MRSLKLESLKERWINRGVALLTWLALTALLVFIAVLSSGCSINLPKTVAAMGRDPASYHLRITSIYATVELTRTNPSTNSQPHTMTPTGTITVGPAK